MEEKLLGTVHFGHGGNLSFGSRVGTHFDAVIRRPSVETGGVTILIDGQVNRELLSPNAKEALARMESREPSRIGGWHSH